MKILKAIHDYFSFEPDSREMVIRCIDASKDYPLKEALKEMNEDGCICLEYAAAVIRDLGGDPYIIADCANSDEAMIHIINLFYKHQP